MVETFDVEEKILKLTAEIFSQFNPGDSVKNEYGEPCITKEDLKLFISQIFNDCNKVNEEEM
jgi:hypothetical protein